MNLVEPIRDKETINAIKDYLKKRSKRNYLLFLLGINTGMAIADLLKLKVRDVEGWHIVYKRQKTLHKNRPTQRIKLQAPIKKEIREYIKGKPKDEYLFKSRIGHNKPITRAMAYLILREAAEEVGIEAIGTHSMRKTWGYFYYKTHNDVADLQEQMNHADPSYTLRYIGIDQEEKDKRRNKVVL
ncbi:tyrosine-type recombinase/integrase [Cytobacillus spongiae]|uniref:tyrosine-type recombinase/integrase n=1 Tax=Cytobacillus spongiae TaxID=2901381 RepID=UPI001F2EE5B8|nr:tyrosine-type recombinase/integrase [Cytobacillus spongiae]UII56701.1 tyrosine-type recombinase/integrase [Cytobacillus spongiae]